MIRIRFLSALLAAFLAIAGSVATAAARTKGDEPVDFARDVWPILERTCIECHGAEQQLSRLRLDSPERILKGGDNGKILVPGKPDESSMWKRTALAPDDLDIMPAEGDPLTPVETELLRRWIEQGADFGGWTGPPASAVPP